MTAQQLKNSILQLVVQGKLVPQDTNDEPASVLLERIQIEKQRFIKGGKARNDKTLPPISEDDIPFDVPESWEWVRLGSIVEIKGGKRVSNGYNLLTTPTEHIYIRVSDMKNGSIDDSDLRYIDDKMFQKIQQYIITKDDLYMTIVGTIGKCGYVPEKFDKMNLTENAARIILHEIDKFFLLTILDSRFCQEQFVNKINQVGVQKMALNRLATTLIPLPPLAEQRRIVERVEQLLPYIANYDSAEQKLTTLNATFPEQLKKSILQSAVQGRLVPQDPNDEPASALLERIRAEKEQLIKDGKLKIEKPLLPIMEDEIPFEVPDSWEWVRIADVTIFQEGPGILAVDFRSDGVPLIRIAGMQGTEVSLDGCNYLDPEMVTKKWNHYRLDEGDVVISTSASMDKIAVVNQVTVGAIPYTGLIRFKMSEALNREYFISFIKSPAYIKQIVEQMAGGMIKHYGPSHLKKMIIPLPPVAEQRRIVARYEDLMAMVDSLVGKNNDKDNKKHK